MPTSSPAPQQPKMAVAEAAAALLSDRFARDPGCVDQGERLQLDRLNALLARCVDGVALAALSSYVELAHPQDLQVLQAKCTELQALDIDTYGAKHTELAYSYARYGSFDTGIL